MFLALSLQQVVGTRVPAKNLNPLADRRNSLPVDSAAGGESQSACESLLFVVSAAQLVDGGSGGSGNSGGGSSRGGGDSPYA